MVASTAPKAPAGQKPSENPGPNGPRTQGTIKTKVDKESKGYKKGHPAYGSADDRRFTCGVITPTDGGAEIFYMARGEAGLALRAGQRVTYVEDENRQGPIAHYVRDAGKGAAAPAATAAAPESDRPEPTDPGAFPALASKASPWGGAPKPKPPPAQTKPKLRGTVTAVKPKQRHGGPGPSYGFVRPDAGGDDVFVAFVDVVDQAKLGEGDRVDYELIPNTGARKSNASGSNANPKYAVKCGRVVILPKGAPHKGAPQEQDPGREESKAEPAPEGYEVVARVLAHLGESRLLPTFLAQQIDDAALPYLEPSDMLELGVAPMICLAILGASAAGGKGKKLETEDVMHDVATHQSVLEEELRGHRAELERQHGPRAATAVHLQAVVSSEHDDVVDGLLSKTDPYRLPGRHWRLQKMLEPPQPGRDPEGNADPYWYEGVDADDRLPSSPKKPRPPPSDGVLARQAQAEAYRVRQLDVARQLRATKLAQENLEKAAREEKAAAQKEKAALARKEQTRVRRVQREQAARQERKRLKKPTAVKKRRQPELDEMDPPDYDVEKALLRMMREESFP